MKYASEMGSGVMIYVPSFIEIGSAIQKLVEVEYTEGLETYAYFNFLSK
jgi:hypothetical protein